MFKLSNRSLNNLKGVHPKLQQLIKEAIKTTPLDFVVVEGVRTSARQNELFKQGKSKIDGIKKKGRHQVHSDGYGHAVDLYPLPIDYKNKEAFKKLSEHLKSTAKSLGFEITWGGDWKSFVDMPHYEII